MITLFFAYKNYCHTLVLYVITGVPDEFGYARVNHRDDVILPCHVTPNAATNVTWLHRQRPHSYFFLYEIYVNGLIYKNLRHRFSIRNATVGDYTLIIRNIWPTDAGRYRCFSRQKLLQNYVIYVVG